MLDPAPQDAFAACRETVRLGDKDRYLALLFAPESLQPPLFAIAAFATELARIPSLVSESPIGEIRLQWWADTLAAMESGEGGSHPVAQALAETVAANSLPLASLSAMVEARRFDLYADVMPDIASVEAYFGETQSALIQLSCMVIDQTAAPKAASAAGFAGVALGLARTLALSPRSERWQPPGKTRDDMLALATTRFEEARSALKDVPKHLLPAFLPAAVTPLYSDAARAGRRDVPQWRRQWRIWRAARSEMI